MFKELYNKMKTRKSIAVIIILIMLILDVLLAVMFHFTDKGETVFVEYLYFTSQIISSIFVSGGVLVAVWQYYLSSKKSENDLRIIQVQRAIDLSEYYKDNILTYLSAINYVFEISGVNKILDTIHPKNMKRFDKTELNKLFTPDQIKSLRNIQQSPRFVKAVLEANEIYDLDLNIRIFTMEEYHDDKKKKICKIDTESVSVAFMSNLINRVLNNMEFFALHFKHKTADESVIYQSLHQTYLRSIPYLYYYIANANSDPSEKLYTNVIWLYEEWNKTKNQKIAEHAEKCASIIVDGTIVNNI